MHVNDSQVTYVSDTAVDSVVIFIDMVASAKKKHKMK